MPRVDSIIEDAKAEIVEEEIKQIETPPSSPVPSKQVSSAPKTSTPIPTPSPKPKSQVFSPGELIFIAVKADNSRFDEALELAKIITIENPSFNKQRVIETVIKRWPVGNTVFSNKKIVQIDGIGDRCNAHVSAHKVVDYFRMYPKEIAEGDKLSLPIGEGRTKGYAVYGQVLYSNNGSKIQYWHAHEKDKMA